ncbi:hypothetical protein BDQ17DRAFT_1329909 [Cyathus striatus]|nr:hypothetical protein BDQ17DRAFT_1329909 [Cyathus striatus]
MVDIISREGPYTEPSKTLVDREVLSDQTQMPGYFSGAHDFIISDASFIDNSDISVVQYHVTINVGNGYMLAIGGIFGSVLNADWGALIETRRSVTSTETINVQVEFKGEKSRTYMINIPTSPETRTTVQISLPKDGDITQSLSMFAEMRKVEEPAERRTFATGCNLKPGEVTYIGYATGLHSWSFALYLRKFNNFTSVKSLVLWGIISSMTLIHYSRYHYGL